jgi:nucleolar protein 56
LLGARLIKLSNGLKRMATLPASTIQILGAEDAFFRFLKTGQKPPKHGVIFQHPEIRNSGRQLRGKLARTLASKLAVASKIDAYHGEYIGGKLNEDFMKRVQTLKK